MSDAAVAERGTWRKGEFVRWTDLFIFIEASFVWIGALFVVGFVVASALIAKHYSPAVLAEGYRALAKDYTFVQAIGASYYLVLLFFLWRIARRVSDSALVARYRSVPVTKVAIGVLAGIALGLAVPLLSAYLVSRHLIDIQMTEGEKVLMPATPGQLPFVLITVSLIAPFTEELFFRGIVLSWLKRKMPMVLAIFASAAIFALVHFDFVSHAGVGGWYITAVIAVIGLVNAVLAVRTGSLWVPFGLHAAYNATLISLPILAVGLK
jgi:membrane protease YdiL (CAAX protease family)